MDAALNYELIKMSCKIYRHSFCAVVVLDKTICCHYVHLAEKVTPPLLLPAPGMLVIAHLFTTKVRFSILKIMIQRKRMFF